MKFLGPAPSNAADLVTKSYADGLTGGGGVTLSGVETLTNKTIDGADNTISNVTGWLLPVRTTCKGGETYTISAGNVTEIAGTTINGISMSTGYRILIQGAPTSTGSGVDYNTSDSAANGLYTVTGTSGGNTQVARAQEMSGPHNPLGLSMFLIEGDWIPKSFITVTSTTNYASFTYGTDRMYFEGTGGRNLNINSAFFAAITQTIGISNGTGATYIQPTSNSGSQLFSFPGSAAGSSDTLLSRNTARTVSTITSPTTLSASGGDLVVFMGAGSSATLPTAVSNKVMYVLKNVDTTNKTVSTTSSQTIDGSLTITLRPNQSVNLISDNANWRII